MLQLDQATTVVCLPYAAHAQDYHNMVPRQQAAASCLAGKGLERAWKRATLWQSERVACVCRPFAAPVPDHISVICCSMYVYAAVCCGMMSVEGQCCGMLRMLRVFAGPVQLLYYTWVTSCSMLVGQGRAVQ
jgi:hypothetical protein